MVLDDQVVAGSELVALIQKCQFLPGSLTVAARAGVQGALGTQHFFVQRVALEAVAFVVFITQVQQAAIGVVAELDGMAEGVNPLDQPATAVITQAGDALCRVGVGGELAGRVDAVAINAAIGSLAFDQIAAGVVVVVGAPAAISNS